MISNEIRNEVRQRASSATSEKQMGGIIYETLRANDICWRDVGSDNVKQLLVDAIYAYRQARRERAFDESAMRVAV